MFLIQEILVSDAVIKERFVCNLNQCKGNCCQEGDYGAPVKFKEMKIIESNIEKYKPYLSDESLNIIDQKGIFDSFGQKQFNGIRLRKDGACIFMGRSEQGIASCTIEEADKKNNLGFKKPISCHLYPIRAEYNPLTGFHALNYDEWDICSPACAYG